VVEVVLFIAVELGFMVLVSVEEVVSFVGNLSPSVKYHRAIIIIITAIYATMPLCVQTPEYYKTPYTEFFR
jgi:hypothetical protein